MALNIPSNSNATPIVPELQSDEKIVQSKAFQWKGGSKGRLAKIIKLMATIVQNNVGTTALVSTDERVFVSEATNSDLKILCCITIMKRNSGHAVQYFPPQLSSVHKSYEVSRCPVFGIQVKACTLESENSTIKIFAEGSEVAKEVAMGKQRKQSEDGKASASIKKMIMKMIMKESIYESYNVPKEQAGEAMTMIHRSSLPYVHIKDAVFKHTMNVEHALQGPPAQVRMT